MSKLSARGPGQTEFIALIAMLSATIAFSIDAMMPALPDIAAELTPDAPNAAQLIITSFVLGMGIGTVFAGPLSDSFGRRRIIVLGAILYCAGAIAAYFAPTLETVLIARIVQGLGAAGPRIVSLALVRDLYKGRDMARIVSFVMMVFTLVPAIAPLLGNYIIIGFGWRAIFMAFTLFSLLSLLWFMARQPETLKPENRRTLQPAALLSALREILSNRMIVTAIAVQTLIYAVLFGTLSTAQPIFDISFDRAAAFPLWFGLVALVSGSASLLNAAFVGRFGMRYLITRTLAAQIAFSLFMMVMTGFDLWPAAIAFPVFILWMISLFAMVGLTLGNLNAMALEPVGHIAGMAASINGAIATVLAVAIAAPLGLAFDGTILPISSGVFVLITVSYLLMLTIPRPVPSP